MEEVVIEERPGLMGRLSRLFGRTETLEPEAEASAPGAPALRPQYRYTVTVRRQIVTIDDAYAAAHGLKRGEGQILNLSATEPNMRQRIVDFMCGVSFAEEGTWEEIGDHIYLVVPATAYVEVSPPTPRSASGKN
jgi:cell division inhibitor SepF